MPRISIYIPDDLAAKMKDCHKRTNWSGIAQKAFETFIRGDEVTQRYLKELQESGV